LELAVWNFVGIWNLEFGVCGLKFLWSLMLGAWCFLTAFCSPPVAAATLAISPQPLHPGHINPMLFGNFIELLDDLVPGMWAEMLNDRSFEGVTKLSNWVYYDGAPDFCDREWNRHETWAYDTQHPFNGSRSAKLSASRHHPASLSQNGLAVEKGMTYIFSGHFRADNPSLSVTATLKSPLPNGQWMTLASAKLPRLSPEWQKYSLQLASSGESDRAVFEVRVRGQGHVWTDKLSLMPAHHLRGWRPDVIEAVRDVRPAIIRWGGSVCDPGEYRWKNGIGDRDLRTPFPNKVWGRIDSNDVGIDEFCQFCELVGAQPLICLSFSDGPQSAADLVEYCNGDAGTTWGAKRGVNGHRAPYRVRYWQIGNEIGGDTPAYLDSIATFCQRMKHADPAAVLMASFPSQKLIERAGRDIAYIGPHHYTPDFAACERDFTSLTEMIAKAPGCDHLRIAVTEWNVSGGNWGLLRGKFLTLETALLNARYLSLLMRHSDKADIACRSNLANSLGSGIIATSPSGLLKRPSFYVMRLYSHHVKPIPLRLDSATDGPDVFACASEGKKSVVIFAVNSKTEPVHCALAFPGFAGSVRIVDAEALCDTLDARQPDVMNHWNAPERIKTIPLSSTHNTIVLPALSAAALECKLLPE
jgi:alpha-N-arabinofuranosidase